MENICLGFSKDYSSYSIEFKFTGNLKKNEDISEINDRIHMVFDNRKGDKNSIKDISFIRTILRDFYEKSLLVRYTTKDAEEIIFYANGLLSSYVFKKFDNHDVFYLDDKGIHISLGNEKKSSLEYLKSQYYIDEVRKFINCAEDLQNVREIRLDKNMKMLNNMFYLFFGYVPNFSDNSDIRKLENMIFIMSYFDLDFGYKFIKLNGYDLPVSVKLHQMIEKLVPYGNIPLESFEDISENDRKLIVAIGNGVKDLSQNILTDDDFLKVLSESFYRKNLFYSNFYLTDRVCEEIKSDELSRKLAVKVKDHFVNF